MVNSNIFLGSGASTTLVPEQDLVIANITQSYTNNNELNFVDFGSIYSLVPNLYIGCEFEIYSEATNGTGDALVSTHTIKSNTSNSLISATNVASFETAKMHYIIIKRYGAPSPSTPAGTGQQRLNADNWIGIAETITFPTLEQELKQMGLKFVRVGGKFFGVFEQSVIVINPEIKQIARLNKKFGQWGFLWGEKFTIEPGNDTMLFTMYQIDKTGDSLFFRASGSHKVSDVYDHTQLAQQGDDFTFIPKSEQDDDPETRIGKKFNIPVYEGYKRRGIDERD